MLFIKTNILHKCQLKQLNIIKSSSSNSSNSSTSSTSSNSNYSYDSYSPKKEIQLYLVEILKKKMQLHYLKNILQI